MKLRFIPFFVKNCFDVGMNILRNLILYRFPINEKCMDILLNFTQNGNDSMRNNAIDMTKYLYKKEKYQEFIEVKLFLSTMSISTENILLEICFERFINI